MSCCNAQKVRPPCAGNRAPVQSKSAPESTSVGFRVLIQQCFATRSTGVAGDSAHAGQATITTSPFLTDRVMWGCVRLSELPSSSFMMSSMRSLQWEYTVWGCLPAVVPAHTVYRCEKTRYSIFLNYIFTHVVLPSHLML